MMMKRRENMDTLMKILNEIDDGINWEKETAVIDDRLLDSFGVITLVSELEDAFGIEIEASEMVPENFNSAEAMYQMISRLKEK
jgi:D-alanine--poly(phosphoribitol) ligase subunit 2